MVKHLGKAPPAGASILMTDGEFENFWNLLDARRRVDSQPAERRPPSSGAVWPQMGAEVAAFRPPAAQAAHARAPSKPYHRCGTCRGCTSTDCGLCKNCRDKPRFGGPGIKKKACLRRQCLKMRREDDDDNDDDEQPEQSQSIMPPPTSVSSPTSWAGSPPQSAQPSPLVRPSTPPTEVASPTHGLHDVNGRPPLEEAYLNGGPFAMPNASCQLDVLSRMATHDLTHSGVPTT